MLTTSNMNSRTKTNLESGQAPRPIRQTQGRPEGFEGRLDSGQAMMVATIFFLVVSTTMIFGLVGPILKQQKIASNLVLSRQSYFLAEAGLENVVYKLKTGKPVAPTETLSLDGNTATIITTDTLGGKQVISTADVKNVVRKVEVNLILGVGTVFHYGVQVGAGGLEMDENSNIIGGVYSNGSISGESGAKISGDAIVATSITENLVARSINCLQDIIVGQTNPQIDFAQSFVAPSSDSLAKVSLYLKKVGNPSSRTVKIVADDNGSPDDNSLVSGTLNKDLVTTSYGWIDITFSSPPLLAAGNTYWVILNADQNHDKYWIWCNDSSSGYGAGVGKYSKDWDDDPWTQITGDLNFRTYFGAGASFLEGVTVLEDAKANTITDSKICGDAHYKNIDTSSLNFLNNPTTQVCGTPITNGTAYPNSPDPPVENMPISQGNIDQWKIDAQAGGTISGNYSVTSNVSLGPKEITGNLLMTSNNKTLTVTGTIYVRGNIDIKNGSKIRCSASYGASSCLIVADGWIHLGNNGTFAGSGTAGSFIMLLTTLACDGSFSTGCTGHNGAVEVHNNATGVIFYVQNGKIYLHNGVNVTEVIAYKLALDNNATVTYDQGLMNTIFSSGPSGGYEILNWREIE